MGVGGKHFFFFQCSIEFSFTHGHLKCCIYSSRGYAVYENIFSLVALASPLMTILLLVVNLIYNTAKIKYSLYL